MIALGALSARLLERARGDAARLEVSCDHVGSTLDPAVACHSRTPVVRQLQHLAVDPYRAAWKRFVDQAPPRIP